MHWKLYEEKFSLNAPKPSHKLSHTNMKLNAPILHNMFLVPNFAKLQKTIWGYDPNKVSFQIL
jgi:hypothetical protein